MADKVEVAVKFIDDGEDGPGWYAWEKEYPEEGYFLMSPSKKPDQKMVEAVHEDYLLIED
jgi:hypothetical protein